MSQYCISRVFSETQETGFPVEDGKVEVKQSVCQEPGQLSLNLLIRAVRHGVHFLLCPAGMWGRLYLKVRANEKLHEDLAPIHGS